MKVGLQLYTVEKEVKQDMDAALKAVKEMGYDYVELGGYYGKTPEEVAELLKKYDLQAISIHQLYGPIIEDPETTIAGMKTVGVKYSAIPWMGIDSHKGHENFEKAMEDITKAATLLKENGIQMLYHNHDFEFQKTDDKFVLDWLYETISPELLQPQIDTCWVKYAGYDPSEYIRKYAGRIEVVHLKDFVCDKLNQGPVYELQGDTKENCAERKKTFGFRPVGYGVQDFPAILKAAEEAGAEYVIVEQDKAETASPMECARMSREYLRSLGY